MQEDMIQASRLIDESIMRSIDSAVIKEFDIKPLGRVEQITKQMWQS